MVFLSGCKLPVVQCTMKRHCSHLTLKNTNVSPFGSQNRHEEEIGRFVVDFVQNPDRQTSLVAETDCNFSLHEPGCVSNGELQGC